MDPRIDLKFVFQEDRQEREYDGKKQPSSLALPGFDSEYYPAGVLAREFDYAVDYVSWLARTGKVQALRKGKRWHVTRTSLQAHKESAKTNQQQSGLNSQEAVPSIVPSLPRQSSKSEGESSVKQSTYRKADIAQAVSMFILAGGLFVFYILNLGIIKIDFDKQPLANGYENIQASFLNPISNDVRKEFKNFSNNTLAVWDKFLDFFSPRIIEKTIVVRQIYQKDKPEHLISDVSNPKSIQIEKTSVKEIIREIASLPSATLAALDSRISDLDSKLAALGSQLQHTPTIVRLPDTNTKGVGPITLNPQRLESETLAVSSSATLASLTVDTNATISGNLNVTGTTTFSNAITSNKNLEIQGTASASYGLFGTLQVAGFSSASYSRFGTSTTTHSANVSSPADILISGDLEIDGSLFADANLFGINSEIQGTSSSSYGLFSNTIQVGGNASVSYNRFGTNTTSHSGTISGISDLLVSGGFEVNGSSAFDGFALFSAGASISTNFEITGNNRFGINSGNVTNNTLEVGGTASISGALTLRGITYTFPSTQTANKFLQTDGSGTLSWATAGVSSNSLDFDEFVDTMLLDADLTINRGGYKIGIGSSPSTVFEVQGTASASYLLTGNTLQVGGFASAAYSRFGTSTTGHSNYISTTNDLLVSGDLEVKGSISANIASASRMFISNPTASASLSFRGNGSGGTNQSIFSIGVGNGTERLDIFNNDNSPFVTIASSGNVGIGTTAPGSKLDVTTTSLGTTQTTSSGLALANTTAAAAGLQQISPAIRWSGFGWKTDAVAASQAVDFRSYVVPVQGAVNPTGYLAFESSINGGAYSATPAFVITSAGNIGIGTTGPNYILDVQKDVTYAGDITNGETQFAISGKTNSNKRMQFGYDTSTTNGFGYIKTGNKGVVYTPLYLNPDLGASGVAIGYTNAAATPPTNGLLVNGNVGIGTTGPLDVLHVVGDIRTSACASDGAGDVACVDVAETFPVSDNLEAGDVVSVDENFQTTASSSFAVKRGEAGAELLGIVSTSPAVLIEGNQARFGGPKVAGVYAPGDKAPVALAGRVPVKVSFENGPVNVGDRLTVGSMPGVAVKMTEAGQSIGIALESFVSSAQHDGNIGTGTGKIMVFVNLSYWGGDIAEMAGNSDIPGAQSGSVIFDAILTKLSDWGVIITQTFTRVSNLFAGTLHVEEKICVDDICLEKEKLKALLIQAGATPHPSPEASEGTVEPTPEATPEPELTTSDVTESIPTPEVTSEPEPEIIPEPTPETTPEIEPI